MIIATLVSGVMVYIASDPWPTVDVEKVFLTHWWKNQWLESSWFSLQNATIPKCNLLLLALTLKVVLPSDFGSYFCSVAFELQSHLNFKITKRLEWDKNSQFTPHELVSQPLWFPGIWGSICRFVRTEELNKINNFSWMIIYWTKLRCFMPRNRRQSGSWIRFKNMINCSYFHNRL